MDKEKPYFFRQALSDALIFALVLIMFSLVNRSPDMQVKLGIYGNALMGLIVIVLIVGMLIIFTKRYRNRYLDGVINFRTAFNYSMLIIIISTVTLMMYDYVFLTYIDPDYIERTKEILNSQITEMISEQGLTGAQADRFTSLIPEKIPTASESAKGSGVSNLLWGLIASAISGAVCVKKSIPESFKEIE